MCGIGTAFLKNVSSLATAAYVIANNSPLNQYGQPPADALIHGFTQAFLWSAGLLLLGAVVWVTLINADRNTLASNDSPSAHVG